jgi:hypothetical protein
MITIKTDAFEASVTPFSELSIKDQYAAIASSKDEIALFTVLVPLFREQLSPDKLAEFDELTTVQVNEVLTKFIIPSDQLKVCEHGHESKKECDAYNAGSRNERDYLMLRALMIGGRFGRKVYKWLEGETGV